MSASNRWIRTERVCKRSRKHETRPSERSINQTLIPSSPLFACVWSSNWASHLQSPDIFLTYLYSLNISICFFLNLFPLLLMGQINKNREIPWFVFFFFFYLRKLRKGKYYWSKRILHSILGVWERIVYIVLMSFYICAYTCILI